MQSEKKVFIVTNEFIDPKINFKFAVRAHIMAENETLAKTILQEWGLDQKWKIGTGSIQILSDRVMS